MYENLITAEQVYTETGYYEYPLLPQTRIVMGVTLYRTVCGVHEIYLIQAYIQMEQGDEQIELEDWTDIDNVYYWKLFDAHLLANVTKRSTAIRWAIGVMDGFKRTAEYYLKQKGLSF